MTRPTGRWWFPVASMVALALGLGESGAALFGQDRVYELRTYTAEEGKLEALHRRFRDHTIALFEKHGMQVIGFWTPTDPAEAPNTLVYLLAHASDEARRESWRAFAADEEWKRVAAASQVDGPLVKKVDSKLLKPTDYSALR